jgi:hypothetical protein
MTVRAVLEGLNISDDGTEMTFAFRYEGGFPFFVSTSTEFLEQTTGLLQSAFFSMKQCEEAGETVERNIHWAKTPVAHIGPPAVATSPIRNEIVLVHARGGQYQTAYALTAEQTEKLIQDLAEGLEELRSGIVKL